MEDPPLYFDLSATQSVLCIGAHPDDIEIGCGGTILSLLDRNPKLRVDWAVFGCNAVRKPEARESFDAWCGGNKNCFAHLFDFEDTLFPSQIVDIKKAMHTLSASIQPDIVFTHRREDLHQDHRTLAEVTWNTFRNHLVLEYEIPKYEGDLGNPNVFSPIAESHAAKKIELLLSLFVSQQGKPWFDRATFQAIMRIRGVECKSKSGFAEAFHGRKIWLAT